VVLSLYHSKVTPQNTSKKFSFEVGGGHATQKDAFVNLQK